MRAKLPLVSALAFAVGAGIFLSEPSILAIAIAVLCIAIAVWLIGSRDREIAALSAGDALWLMTGRRPAPRRKS